MLQARRRAFAELSEFCDGHLVVFVQFSKGFSSILVLNVRLNLLLNITHCGCATLRTQQIYRMVGINIKPAAVWNGYGDGNAIAYSTGCQKWTLTGHQMDMMIIFSNIKEPTHQIFHHRIGCRQLRLDVIASFSSSLRSSRFLS